MTYKNIVHDFDVTNQLDNLYVDGIYSEILKKRKFKFEIYKIVTQLKRIKTPF